MTYYYIHGFNSGVNSSTISKIRDAMKVNVIPLGYDSKSSYEENINTLIQQVFDEDACFIGTSLGAFYANKIASHFGCPCVLFNPVCDPFIELQQFLGENINFSSGESYIFSKETLASYAYTYFVEDNGIPRTIFVSENDEVLVNNVNKVNALYGGKAEISIINGSHRIEDFTPYVGRIISTANTVCA